MACSVESNLLYSCLPLMLDKICPDWFNARQCRLTATTTDSFLLDRESISEAFGLQNSDENIRGAASGFESQCNCWSSLKRISKRTMRRTKNEPVTLNTLSCYDWLHILYSAGMLADADNTWCPCFTDGISTLHHVLLPRGDEDNYME